MPSDQVRDAACRPCRIAQITDVSRVYTETTSWRVTPSVSEPSDDLLQVLIGAPDWQLDSLCREHPEVNWFPERGESSTDAKAVCARCLVQAECLAFALDERIEHGVWAGTSARQRRKMWGAR